MDRDASTEASEAKSLDVKRWMVGCAVGAAATVGIGILVFLVAFALQPPVWVQVVLGGLLAIGAAIFSWLVASAWSPRDAGDETPSKPERDA